MRVSPGIEQLLADPGARLRGAAVGLLANQAGVLPDLRHDLDGLLAAGVNVVAALGPEHGFRGTAQAGFSEPTGTDPTTGLPVYDTYGAGMEGMAVQLEDAGVEVLLVDLQDVGVRFYTVVSTLYDAIGAAGRSGRRVLVLDRPNPIGGLRVEGPVLRPGFASFVGRAPIPLRHGMTLGELARLFAAMLGVPGVDVVPMAGWRRSMYFADTGLCWVPPSPNMPTATTAVCYPGTCLFEGTNLSAGRGTTAPFEVFGAPWADARLAAALAAQQLPGMLVREAHFVPAFSVHAGEPVAGAQLHLTDPRRADPVRAGLTAIRLTRTLWPERLEFRPDQLDRLCGTDAVRLGLEAGNTVEQLSEGWEEELVSFRDLRAGSLIYPEHDGER